MPIAEVSSARSQSYPGHPLNYVRGLRATRRAKATRTTCLRAKVLVAHWLLCCCCAGPAVVRAHVRRTYLVREWLLIRIVVCVRISYYLNVEVEI